MSPDNAALTAQLIDKLKDKGLMVTAAESCTGGMIMAQLTDIAGASSVVDRGFVTYSNQAKSELLGVQESTLKLYGAVSAETAFEMVTGASDKANGAATIAVTGIAGPDGGSKDKPVGTVWIATSTPQAGVLCKDYQFPGDRQAVREQTVKAALVQILSQL